MNIAAEVEPKVKKTIENLKKNLAGIRTGRASTGLLDPVRVEYYGTEVPLIQLANVSIGGPRLLVIQPYDKAAGAAIEKAILKANLGITPSMEGGVIRLPLPEINEERRKDLVKVIKKEAEDARIAIRNIRREVLDHAKKAKDAKEISEDQEKQQGSAVEKIIAREMIEIDKMIVAKEKEVLEV
jgi:ribosome recycling factor